jgi:hypothetical protein
MPCDCRKVRRSFSGRPYLIHVGWRTPEYNALIARHAEELSLDYEWVGVNEDLFKTAGLIKNAAMAVIWNGMQHYSPLVSRLCSLREIPLVFYEWGLLPQKETFTVDPHGLTGNSILMTDLGWIEHRDVEEMLKVRQYLQAAAPLAPVKNRVLVIGQVESDSQILHHTAYNRMEDFVHDVEVAYPDKDIVVRPHPKSKAKITPSNSKTLVQREGDLLKVAASCELVVGLTSTALYEAGILGVPVKAMGCHPLAVHEDHERVLAGIWALRVHRKTGRLSQVTQRFGIKPHA